MYTAFTLFTGLRKLVIFDPWSQYPKNYLTKDGQIYISIFSIMYV